MIRMASTLPCLDSGLVLSAECPSRCDQPDVTKSSSCGFILPITSDWVLPSVEIVFEWYRGGLCFEICYILYPHLFDLCSCIVANSRLGCLLWLHVFVKWPSWHPQHSIKLLVPNPVVFLLASSKCACSYQGIYWQCTAYNAQLNTVSLGCG